MVIVSSMFADTVYLVTQSTQPVGWRVMDNLSGYISARRLTRNSKVLGDILQKKEEWWL